MTGRYFPLGSDKAAQTVLGTPLLGEFMGKALPAVGTGSPSAASIHPTGIFCWEEQNRARLAAKWQHNKLQAGV